MLKISCVHRYKRSISAFILAALSLSFSSELFANNCDEMNYNGNNEWYPVFYRPQQQAYGIVNDVLISASAMVEQKLNLASKTPLKRQLLELKFGKLDLLAGAIKTYENERHFLVSTAISSANVTVFTRQDANLSIQTPSDLKSLKGATLIGMKFGDDLNDFILNELIVEETISLASVFKMLKYGRVDYAIYYEQAGLNFLTELNLNDTIKSHSLSLESKPVHILASKNNHCLDKANIIFRQIDMMIDNGDINPILERYPTQKAASEDITNGI